MVRHSLIWVQHYRCLNKHADALVCYQQALRINPTSVEAWNNLGTVHEALGRTQAAVEHYRRALSIRPGYAEAQNNLGNALARLDDLPAAMASYRRAIELKPDYAEAHYNLGLVYVQLGLAHEAVTAYRHACALGAGHAGACENLLLMLNYDPSCSAEEIFKQHAHWGETRGILSGRNYTNHSDRDRRLRVGYVSPDFRNHSVAFFIEAVLAQHDAARFDVFCYANVGIQDTMTAHLQKYAPHWRNIFGKNAEEVLATIHADKIDILVDLAGHTGGNRLDVFAHRAAPVQVTYLGYPNTTGLSTMNYRITDIWADPPGREAFHTETLVRLPQGFLCYSPRLDAPAVAPLPALKEGHITFGSFNSMLKITPQVISIWSQILHALPNTRIVLKNESLREPLTRQHCQTLFADAGISAGRVEFLKSLPSAIDHLALYNCVDIALDTFPYNGTTTSCEAMWMGAPVVTLEGICHAGRVGVSLLHQVGLTELIAKTQEEYVQIAANLAKDVDKLATLRAGLRPRMAASPLCDGEGFTRALEQAYREMWRMWCTQTATGTTPPLS